MAGYPPKPMISVKNLIKTYQTGAEPFDALRSLTFTIGANEYVGIIGKSGAGKTTLINMLSGVDQITSGEVYIN
ncbi:MAG: ATP-binding cassette domain-containing protein, partial [Bacillota bacterium]|nr:ATP-binding cassette domain-containing protein [Bacillota bacterium]